MERLNEMLTKGIQNLGIDQETLLATLTLATLIYIILRFGGWQLVLSVVGGTIVTAGIMLARTHYKQTFPAAAKLIFPSTNEILLGTIVILLVWLIGSVQQPRTQ